MNSIDKAFDKLWKNFDKLDDIDGEIFLDQVEDVARSFWKQSRIDFIDKLKIKIFDEDYDIVQIADYIDEQ